MQWAHIDQPLLRSMTDSDKYFDDQENMIKLMHIFMDDK